MVSHRDRDDEIVSLGKPAVETDNGGVQPERLHGFMRHVLADLQALEQILESDMIESGVRRIGAEQEMFLVDAALRPATVNQEVLARIDDPRLTSELAQFNLEANISPRIFGGSCLSEMERELDDVVRIARVGAQLCAADVVLVGILPTLRIGDLGMENMTPNPRYREMDQALARLRGHTGIKVQIKGLDEIDIVHDNVML
ncbi:MAG: hypothetical protein KC609_12325, partial [Myxococcales bacterium]|nr:hypothetical protein [Myxococcales bacterium]